MRGRELDSGLLIISEPMCDKITIMHLIIKLIIISIINHYTSIKYQLKLDDKIQVCYVVRVAVVVDNLLKFC